MKFPCNDCGEKICLWMAELSDVDFLTVRCAYCGSVNEYSRVRIKEKLEK